MFHRLYGFVPSSKMTTFPPSVPFANCPIQLQGISLYMSTENAGHGALMTGRTQDVTISCSICVNTMGLVIRSARKKVASVKDINARQILCQRLLPSYGVDSAVTSLKIGKNGSSMWEIIFDLVVI
jgi:hypothetical protein